MNPPVASVEAIFLEAIDKETPLERSAFLEAACGADHHLRRRVEALLRAHEQAGDFLATPLPERELSFPLDPNDTPVARTPPEEGMRERYLLNLLNPPRREGCLGTLGPYEVTGVLGSGGMSVVFRAHDPRLNRVVALKVLAPELAADAVARQRFLREGQAAAALRHENVTAIHTIEDTDPIPYLVMEFIDGESLQQLLDRGETLSPQEIVQIGRQTAAGLAAAHAQELIHRDVKPANVLLDRERQVKITDFGLARTVNDARLTHPGLLAGTPRFMSPEQAQAQPVDPRTDLFSLGSVLYTLCAGRPPFLAETTMGTLRLICDGTPTPLADLRPEIPGWLVEVIDRLMEKDPDRRFQSAAEVEEALARHRLNPPARRRSSRRLMFLSVAAFLAVTTALLWAAGALGWLPSGQDPVDSRTTMTNDRLVPQPEQAPREMGKQPRVAPPPQLWGEVRRITTEDSFDVLALSPDGEVVYAGGVSGAIHAFDVGKGEAAGQFRAPRGVRDMVISPDGKRLAACTFQTVLVWDLPSGKLLLNLTVAPTPWRLAFSPDGRSLAVCVFGGKGAAQSARGVNGHIVNPHRVTIFELATGRPVRSLAGDKPDWFYSVAWSPDGKWIAAGTDGGEAVVWDARSDEIVFQWSEQTRPVHMLLFSRDGKRLYLSDNRNTVYCRNMADGKLTLRRQFNDPFIRFAVNSDETWIAVTGIPEVRLCDLTNQVGSRSVIELPGHQRPVRGVAFLPDDEYVVTAALDGTVRVWKLPPR